MPAIPAGKCPQVQNGNQPYSHKRLNPVGSKIISLSLGSFCKTSPCDKGNENKDTYCMNIITIYLQSVNFVCVVFWIHIKKSRIK